MLATYTTLDQKSTACPSHVYAVVHPQEQKKDINSSQGGAHGSGPCTLAGPPQRPCLALSQRLDWDCSLASAVLQALDPGSAGGLHTCPRPRSAAWHTHRYKQYTVDTGTLVKNVVRSRDKRRARGAKRQCRFARKIGKAFHKGATCPHTEVG